MASHFPLKGILKPSGSTGGAYWARNEPNKALNWGDCPTVPREAGDAEDDAERRERAALFEGVERCMLEDNRSPPSGRRVGVLRTGGWMLEEDWNWKDPDISGLLEGAYPCVLEKLLELTNFEFSVSVPLEKRRREVEVDLVGRRVKAKAALEKGEEPEDSEWELRRTVSDLLGGDAVVQELHGVARLEVGRLQERLGCGQHSVMGE